ncbi:MAG: hypothetical protein COB14_05915 [Alphaproteobacteria bacterium]|nr:MAG: hypothetical protein COB14_05915 [Alphaproteobacteria bacterium]
MTEHNYIPEGYERIKVVGDLCAFLEADFAPVANIVLLQRRLNGDFDALAEKMAAYFDLGEDEIFIKYSERDKIEAFQETLGDPALARCVDVILQDMEFFYSARVKIHMRLLTGYTQDVRTHDFHVDGLEQDFDRFMTCYNDPVTQFIRNDDVIDVSGHDVVYRDDAPIYQFCAGDVWKSRVRNKPKSRADMVFERIMKVKEKRAFVHRAQISTTPRLMVVGDKRLS